MKKFTLQDDLALMEEAGRQAAALAKKFQEQGFERLENKAAGDPFLTEADIAIDTLLRDMLTSERPDYGWLSEETVADDSYKTQSHCFIVDPIDGTRGFVNRDGMFAVSIGLAVDGFPALGVVVNPMQERMISGGPEVGIFYNSQPQDPDLPVEIEGSSCLISVRENKQKMWEDLSDLLDLQVVGSIADKLALVAGTEAKLTASRLPKSLWDICAGDAICRGAGYKVTDLQGRDITYKDSQVVSGLVLAPPALFDDFYKYICQNLPA